MATLFVIPVTLLPPELPTLLTLNLASFAVGPIDELNLCWDWIAELRLGLCCKTLGYVQGWG